MFKNWLRRRRRIAGLTQAALAEKLGTRQSTVSEWERGTNQPAASMIPRLAAAIGVKPSTLEDKIAKSETTAVVS